MRPYGACRATAGLSAAGVNYAPHDYIGGCGSCSLTLGITGALASTGTSPPLKEFDGQISKVICRPRDREVRQRQGRARSFVSYRHVHKTRTKTAARQCGAKPASFSHGIGNNQFWALVKAGEFELLGSARKRWVTISSLEAYVVRQVEAAKAAPKPSKRATTAHAVDAGL